MCSGTTWLHVGQTAYFPAPNKLALTLAVASRTGLSSTKPSLLSDWQTSTAEQTHPRLFNLFDGRYTEKPLEFPAEL